MNNRIDKKDIKKPIIPVAHVPKGKSNVPTMFPKKIQEEVEKLNKEKIHFSFNLLDTTHPAFNCGKVDSSWFMNCFDNFHAVSNLTFNELQSQRRHYDLHRHNFEKTAYHYNDSIAEHVLDQISPENMIQFRLSTSGGRVHGIRYHNIFYVVWLDPYHNMNLDDRFGPAKLHDTPLRPYDLLEIEIQELKLEIIRNQEEIAVKEQDYEDALILLYECEAK
ncbi:hypothetical protein ACFPYN_03155 [Paenisporosarcina macmurdoensis]|uniref:Uncharacterized protein n=1 Tax=Paenisporosarcina macmurdoensis TaxID=212659 RepID=A0ABW1L346_9BACL